MTNYAKMAKQWVQVFKQDGQWHIIVDDPQGSIGYDSMPLVYATKKEAYVAAEVLRGALANFAKCLESDIVESIRAQFQDVADRLETYVRIQS